MLQNVRCALNWFYDFQPIIQNISLRYMLGNSTDHTFLGHLQRFIKSFALGLMTTLNLITDKNHSINKKPRKFSWVKRVTS